jgi:TMEM175 potassium channel family protein
VTTARLETFSDGVFAIAATLLILNVNVTGVPLGRALLHGWPSYVAYAVSFLTIGIMWANHHGVFSQIEKADRTFLMINVVFLMLVAFVPFPTKLVAENIHRPGLEPAALAYGFTLTLTALAYNSLWFYASRGRRLLSADADPKTVTGISRSFLPGPAIYLTATLLAFWWPTLSIVLFAVIAIFYMLESALFGRRVVDVSD